MQDEPMQTGAGQRDRAIYEGKAKILYETGRPDELLVYFKDDATAFNGVKHDQIASKGVLNQRISAHLLGWLNEQGVATHLLRPVNERELLVRRLRMIPVEVIARNVFAGSLASRLGRPEGEPISPPVVEFSLKDDQLGDPWINETHAVALGLCSLETARAMVDEVLRLNALLSPYLLAHGLRLIDFKVEFGLDDAGQLILGDEISPDTCRFWDAETGERLDKDRFRRDLGDVIGAYREVLRRLTGEEVPA